MDYIILDTNIFFKENFLEGKRIQEFLKLSKEGHIRIVLTQIIIDEVKNNYKKQLNKAIEHFGIFKNARESRTFRNNSIGNQLFVKPKKSDLIQEFNDEFDSIIKQSKVIIINYTTLDIGVVFKKYFQNEFPFNKSDKKGEFPDAFSFELIQKWVNNKNNNCTILSTDKDFLNLNGLNPQIKILKDYESFLDHKLKEALLKNSRINILDKLFLSSSEKIDKEISKWVYDQLYDESFFHSFIYVEIHDIQEPKIYIDAKEYQIVSINDDTIEIEIKIEVSYEVTINVDDEESMYYDSDDKMYYYYNKANRNIEGTTVIEAIYSAIIVNEDDYEDELELDGILNNEIDHDYGEY